MASVFIIAGVISITFLIEKESKPLKLLIRDALVVYFSVIVSNFIMEQLNTVIENSGGKKITPVFTDNPGF